MALIQKRQCDHCKQERPIERACFVLDLVKVEQRQGIELQGNIDMGDKDFCSVGCLTNFITATITAAFVNVPNGS
jgi:hypothetical protein